MFNSWSAESLFEKLKHVQVDNPLCRYTRERCAHLAPLVNEILALKKEKNALILAHSYVHPDILYTVADHMGDSYGLAKRARETNADVILFSAVRFMAETAKILNPTKKVIDPNPNGGCSLADSITAEEVHQLRNVYPDHTFVCYINTTAAVKAACDVCVTSSNVYRILEALPNNKIYFLPDRLMGENIQDHLRKRGSDKEIAFYHGSCYVHEEFEAENVTFLKKSYPDLQVVAHPECSPTVIAEADAVHSTTGMLEYVQENKHKKSPFLLLTECGIAARINVESPEIKIVGGCMLCKFMRSNSLEMIKRALVDPKESQIIAIAPSVQEGALRCLEAMFAYS